MSYLFLFNGCEHFCSVILCKLAAVGETGWFFELLHNIYTAIQVTIFLHRFYKHFWICAVSFNPYWRTERDINRHSLSFSLQRPLLLRVIDTQIKSRCYVSNFLNTGTWEVSISLLMRTCKYHDISLWLQSCVGQRAADLTREESWQTNILRPKGSGQHL